MKERITKQTSGISKLLQEIHLYNHVWFSSLPTASSSKIRAKHRTMLTKPRQNHPAVHWRGRDMPQPAGAGSPFEERCFWRRKARFFLPFKSSLHVRPRQPTELSDTQERALGGKTERNRPEKKRLQVSGKETLSPSGWGLSRAMCDHQCDISSVTLAVTVPR